jgi:hypothetical protein
VPHTPPFLLKMGKVGFFAVCVGWALWSNAVALRTKMHCDAGTAYAFAPARRDWLSAVRGGRVSRRDGRGPGRDRRGVAAQADAGPAPLSVAHGRRAAFVPCATSVPGRDGFHSVGVEPGHQTAQRLGFSTLSTGACVRLQRGSAAGRRQGRFGRKIGAHHDADGPIGRLGRSRDRKRRSLLSRARLTRTGRTCILRHPCARPALAGDLEISSTSRLWSSCPGAER